MDKKFHVFYRPTFLSYFKVENITTMNLKYIIETRNSGIDIRFFKDFRNPPPVTIKVKRFINKSLFLIHSGRGRHFIFFLPLVLTHKFK